MKIIDLEHHFFTPKYLEYLRQRKQPPREVIDEDGPNLWYDDTHSSPRSFDLDERMADMGERRLKDMDDNGVDMAVLSLSPPGVQNIDPADGSAWARSINDELSQVVRQHPDRFIGLACIAPQNPEEAADEIERSVNEGGLKGVAIYSHSRNEYLDDKKYWPIFEKAAKLDVPVCMHPELPSSLILPGYADYGFVLAGPILGFAADVALHTVRLILSGLFDRYPELQMVLGHLGEGLPFWLERLDAKLLQPRNNPGVSLERKPSDYIRTNFTFTTSAMFYLPAFVCAHMSVGANRMAFAVDYPYMGFEKAIKFLNDAPIPDADKETMFHRSAERLFKL
ncbi:amidohydrolase family protein [Chloroflexota bacterium]